MADVHFETYPPPAHQGLRPIGRPSLDIKSEDILFARLLLRLSLSLFETVTDMHRLVYLGQRMTAVSLLHCVRLYRGRSHAGWIEAQIAMLSAELKAHGKLHTDHGELSLDDFITPPEDNVL